MKYGANIAQRDGTVTTGAATPWPVSAYDNGHLVRTAGKQAVDRLEVRGITGQSGQLAYRAAVIAGLGTSSRLAHHDQDTAAIFARLDLDTDVAGTLNTRCRIRQLNATSLPRLDRQLRDVAAELRRMLCADRLDHGRA